MNQMSADAVDGFERALERAWGDDASVESLFLAHVNSDFLQQFVRTELDLIVSDPDHIVRRNAGQVNFTLVNTAHFDYTIRLCAPFSRYPHEVKWLGERQLMSVSTANRVSVRVLTVPFDVNNFVAGAQITDIRMVDLDRGSILTAETSNSILDIWEVTAPAVLQVLTIHNPDVSLHWTFDEDLKAVFAEAARMTQSRLQNVLELAHEMRTRVPDSVYGIILGRGNAHEKLLAIESLLRDDATAGFAELHGALDSADATLARGARLMFDALMSGSK